MTGGKGEKKIKAILLEEAIRTMALIGIVIFGILPVAYVLGVDVNIIALIAVALIASAILIFPIIFWIRTRTGVKLQLRSRRGWYILLAIAFALALFMAILMLLTGHISWNQVVARIATSAFVIVVLAWLGTRLIPLE
jgi:hypothetical protein